MIEDKMAYKDTFSLYEELIAGDVSEEQAKIIEEQRIEEFVDVTQKVRKDMFWFAEEPI